MKSAADILADRCIRISGPLTRRRHYATCPECSHLRTGSNKRLRCLGVTIDEKGVAWGCNHCNWKGGEFYERSERKTPDVVRGGKADSRRDSRTLWNPYWPVGR